MDKNQSSVFNINFGLYDFGYLRHQQAMGKLLIKKKLLQKQSDIAQTKHVQNQHLKTEAQHKAIFNKVSRTEK